MDIDQGFDLLAFSDQMGEPFEAAMASDEETHEHRADGPITDEQAAYLGYLTRRLGRLPDTETLTFSQAKARITELLTRLSG